VVRPVELEEKVEEEVLLRAVVLVATRLSQAEIQRTNRQALHILQKGDRMGVLPPSSCGDSLFRGVKARQPAQDTSSISGEESGNVWRLCCRFFLYSMRGIFEVTWGRGIVFPASTQSVRDRMDCDPTESRRRVCCFEGGLRCSEDSEDLCEFVV
jgi:hypothetical protein